MSEIETKASNNAIANKKRNPYTVWFVVMAFIAPVALAYIIFFFVDVKSYVNHGEILNPIIHISDFELTNENNEIIPQDELTYKWRLVSFVSKDCDTGCKKRLYDSRQIHTSLGKNQHRLIRMFVHLQPVGDNLKKLISEEYENVIHVNGNAASIIDALGANVHDDIGIMNNEIYIMDPMGNIMMRFTQEQPNKEFLHDLKKLLKASQIG